MYSRVIEYGKGVRSFNHERDLVIDSHHPSVTVGQGKVNNTPHTFTALSNIPHSLSRFKTAPTSMREHIITLINRTLHIISEQSNQL